MATFITGMTQELWMLSHQNMFQQWTAATLLAF